jgi:hypothetical protein
MNTTITATHTPGPWNVVGTLSPQIRANIKKCSHNAMEPHEDPAHPGHKWQCAECGYIYGLSYEMGGGSSVIADVIAVNNARLIASAPELLAALEKIDSNAAESVEWIRRVARAAIAKATGTEGTR